MSTDQEKKAQCVNVVIAPETPKTDVIVAYFRDIAPKRGSVVITCFGRAWTYHWGGIPDGMTVKDFFKQCDPGYLVSKFMIDKSMFLKQHRDCEVDYLAGVIAALKQHLSKEQP